MVSAAFASGGSDVAMSDTMAESTNGIIEVESAVTFGATMSCASKPIIFCLTSCLNPIITAIDTSITMMDSEMPVIAMINPLRAPFEWGLSEMCRAKNRGNDMSKAYLLGLWRMTDSCGTRMNWRRGASMTYTLNREVYFTLMIFPAGISSFDNSS